MSPQPTLEKPQTHSTGPRTKVGKAISSQNALAHGLASGTLLIYGEDKSAYDALLADLLAEWQPTTPTERLMVHNMAKHHWLVERALRLQGEILTLPGPHNLTQSFAVLLRYQVTNERAFSRAQKSLEDMQRTRREFVSQKEEEVEDARIRQDFASLTAPLPKPNYDKVIERMNAARHPLPPEPKNQEKSRNL